MMDLQMLSRSSYSETRGCHAGSEQRDEFGSGFAFSLIKCDDILHQNNASE